MKLSEWNDNKPNDLFRQLKELEPYKIHIIGTNLIPDNISNYMKKVIDILYKIEDMYNIIRVYDMEVVSVDFTDIKNYYEAYKKISEALNFSKYYDGDIERICLSNNLPALWDLLSGYVPSYEIHLKGTDTVPDYLEPYMKKIIETFQRTETLYNYNKIIIE